MLLTAAKLRVTAFTVFELFRENQLGGGGGKITPELPPRLGLRKCAAGDIVPSLRSLKKHEPKLKFFVSIFGKLHQIKI